MAIINAPSMRQGVTSEGVRDLNSFVRIDTKLEAINLCLAGLGRSGIATTDTTNVDANMASREIDRTSYGLQNNGGNGWWFNKEDDWLLEPNQYNGEIKVPNNVLALIASRCGRQSIRKLAIRGDRIYDLKEHTFDLRVRFGTEKKISFDFVTLLDFDELPPTAAMAVSYAAAMTFMAQQEYDQGRMSVISQSAQTYLMQLQMENAGQQQANYWEQNPMANILAAEVGNDTSLYYGDSLHGLF